MVAAAAETNANITISGRAPAQGVHIELTNPVLFSIIIVLTALMHLCLFTLAAKSCSMFEVPEEVKMSVGSWRDSKTLYWGARGVLRF